MFDPELINYELPPGRVLPKYRSRSDVRLLVVQRSGGGKFWEEPFANAVKYLSRGICYVNIAKLDRPLNDDELEPLYTYRYASNTSIIPTAGVPFSDEMLHALDMRFLELITPAESRIGTEDSYRKKESALEYYSLFDKVDRLNRVIAIGTTAVKTLESYATYGEREGSSNLLITPGYKFKLVEMMMTNFHYPKEILLAMTCAFGGTDLVMNAYKYAMREGFHISDRGDRMLII